MDLDRLSRPDQFITNDDRFRARRHAAIGPIVGCVILGTLGLYPGSFVSLPLWASLGILAIGLITAVASFDCLRFSRTPNGMTAAVFGVMAIVTFGSVKCVPTRIAFPLHRAALEREALSLAPASEKHDVWIGIYHMQRIWRETDGTVWFQVNRSTALANSTSFGFTFQPNRDAPPSTDDGAQLIPLDDSWSIFRRAHAFD